MASHLYILQLIPNARYLSRDVTLAYVIRARSEQDARSTAATRAGDEGRSPWLDPEQSTCKPLEHEGQTQISLHGIAQDN